VTGRTGDRDQVVSEQATRRLFDRLGGPEGLTAHASTFARQDVLVALAANLAGATRAELEGLADRFLAERAVSVVADRALEERRWSVPDLLAVEQRLVAAAVDRAGDHTAVASHQAVREALAAHPTAGPDQQAMVRDLCLGGQGVALVVGRAGTGKTFSLGVARHAWQLDGYRLLATAPTGIAALTLAGEGFEEVATCDRLLRDLDRHRDQLDRRTVLVVDEAGMVGSRRLARLLAHAHQAQAKVVLVGDDRQLAPVDAGGGFRALRLRLGASELVENRRQQHAWEREALDLVRSGLVEEAVAAYRAHDRVVAAESKTAATLALLTDWWAAFQQAECDPGQDQEVVVLAARRAEVDRLNTACQQVLDHNGRLGPDQLQVEDREVRVGDRVVCGRNALRQLGVANGTRGVVTALDPEARTLTIRLDGREPTEVTLPRSYLDGRRPGERNRRVDLAYATTGHRAQALTRWRALVRLTGGEDVNWLYVQLSRARQETRLYAVVGPEPHGQGELDLPDREPPDAYAQLVQALSRPGGQTLAIDTQSTLDLRRLSTRELRAERDRLRAELDGCPRDRRRELERATARREQAEQTLAQLTDRADRQRPAGGMLRLLGHSQPAADPGAVTVARQLADRAGEHEQELRRHQQRRAGWLEANAQLGHDDRRVVRELAWQRRAHGLAQEVIEQDRPGYVRELLGPVPESTRGRRAWRLAAGAVEQYRAAYDVHDPDRALGPEPREPAQRTAWQQARAAVQRVVGEQRAQHERDRERQPTPQPTRQQPPSTTSPAAERESAQPIHSHAERHPPSDRPGPERAAG
jgi:hypothetical protein